MRNALDASSVTFYQTGGSNSAGTLDIDTTTTNQTTYQLQGTASLTAATEIVGDSNYGSFSQGVLNSLSPTIQTVARLFIGANSGALGSYSVNSGTLTVTNGMFIGGNANGPGGVGTLKVNGGSVSITNGLTVYDTNSSFSVGTASSGALLQVDSATLYNSGNTVGGSGIFNVGAGGLVLAGNDNPGLTISGGILSLNGPLMFTGFTGTANISGGTIDLGNAPRTFNISRGTAAVDTIVSSSIVDGSLLKTGLGILVLQGNNTFNSASGAFGVNVSAGTLQITNSAALGGYGATVGPGGTLDLNGANITSGSFTLNGSGVTGNGALINTNLSNSSIAGLVALNSVTLIGGAGNISFGSAVTGVGGLTKIGADTLTLVAADFSGGLSVTQGNLVINQPGTYSGNITLTGGTLAVNSDAALGSIYNALFLEGGAIEASSNFSSGRTIVLAGGGLNVDSGELLTLTGTLLGGSTLVKNGGGTLRLTSASSFGGPVVISAGSLSLAGPGGALPYVTSVDIQTGGILELNSAISGNQGSQNRLSDSAPITLDGGTLALNGSNTASTTETLGTLIPSTGASTVIAMNGFNGSNSVPSTLTFASLGTRAPGATVEFEGNGSIFFASGQAALGGWATINGSDFAKYSSTLGIIPFTTLDYSVNVFTAGTNVKLDTVVTSPAVPTNVPNISIATL